MNPFSIGTITQRVLTPLFQKQKHLQLMVEWPSIVGPEISSYTWPQKIVETVQSGGILHLQVCMMKKMEAWGHSPVILERTNQYFGYQAVKRIRFAPRPPAL